MTKLKLILIQAKSRCYAEETKTQSLENNDENDEKTRNERKSDVQTR